MERSWGVDSSLKDGAIHRVPEVRCTELVQHGDDTIATDVGSVAECRSPVVVADASIFRQQVRMRDHEGTHRIDIVIPDGVDHVARLHDCTTRVQLGAE